jgi:hypothetical protein
MEGWGRPGESLAEAAATGGEEGRGGRASACTALWVTLPLRCHACTCSPPNAVIDRGIALHKMIRLITMTLGGEQ